MVPEKLHFMRLNVRQRRKVSFSAKKYLFLQYMISSGGVILVENSCCIQSALNFTKTRTQQRMFSCEVSENFQDSFSTEPRLVVASE